MKPTAPYSQSVMACMSGLSRDNAYMYLASAKGARMVGDTAMAAYCLALAGRYRAAYAHFKSFNA